MACNSVAAPKCQVRSGLLVSDLLSTSITRLSSRGNFSFIGVQRSLSDISSRSSFKSRIECFSISSLIPNSSLEQIIPFDSIPLIFLFSIVIPAFSKCVHGNATGTYNPAAILAPPQMIWYSPLSPQSTMQTLSLSASGCFSQDLVCPITILSAIFLSLISSISHVLRMKFFAIFSGVSLIEMNFFRSGDVYFMIRYDNWDKQKT